MNLLIAVLSLVATLASASEPVAPEFPTLLTLSELRALRPERQELYFQMVQELLQKIETAQNDPRRVAAGSGLLGLLLPEACAADRFSDVRRVGQGCIYAGNVSKYVRRGPGRPICEPTHQITVGRTTYRCENRNEVVCNPLAFGFQFDESEKRPGGVSYERTLTKRKPICVPAALTATKDCGAKAQLKYASVMLFDMGLAGEFNAFTDKTIKPFCEAQRTGLLNKTECGVVTEMIKTIRKDFETDPRRFPGASTTGR